MGCTVSYGTSAVHLKCFLMLISNINLIALMAGAELHWLASFSLK